ncbi:MAG: glutamate--cysteine ligase [Propionibacteriaceae bacterium]|jgi:carboxylate-amine ligase|nr:glutamate--cysteine ligase [Propionibacteriaceae bacterium]
MDVVFGKSAQSSVGIEWELNLVDKQSLQLTPVAGKLLEAVGGGDGLPIRKDYLQCMIEIVSGAHATIGEAIADIETQFNRLVEAADAMGVVLMGSGSHPISHPAAQPPFRNPRYDVVTNKNQWWGRQVAICGTHVHVGVSKQEYVLPVTWTFARFYPYLLALSASSPFWDGTDTGYASQRTMIFQQLPTNGLPFRFDTWEAFEQMTQDLVDCEMITEVNELRWDVRPSPKFGTVENRIPDSVPTLKELGFLAALTQSLGEYFYQALNEGDTPDYLPPWLVRENKWRAARYGLDATVITPDPNQRLLPLRDAMGNLLNFLAPYAAQLGCTDELAFGHELLAKGASYERQRRLAGRGGLPELRHVVHTLCMETLTNTPSW